MLKIKGLIIVRFLGPCCFVFCALITWLKGYLDNDNTVIVGWKGSEAVEIISLESHSKRLLNDALTQWQM